MSFSEKLGLAVCLIMAVVFLAGFVDAAIEAEPAATPVEIVVERRVVHEGDTLWAIAEEYVGKSALKRDIREFQEGIYERNYSDVFIGRPKYTVWPGDVLVIQYARAVNQ